VENLDGWDFTEFLPRLMIWISEGDRGSQEGAPSAPSSRVMSPSILLCSSALTFFTT